MRLRFLMASLLAATYVQTIVSAHELSSAELKAIQNRDILISAEKLEIGAEKFAVIDGHILINASPQNVWRVMTDCARGPEYVPGLKSCEVLELGPATEFGHAWDKRRFRNKVGFLLPTITSEFRNDYTYPSRIVISRTGGDLKTNDAMWEITPSPDGFSSHVNYHGIIAADTIIPDAIVRSAMRSNLPKVLEALRAEVEKNTP
jgi:carbon monoxide dehydrogenase subunit G